MLLLKNVLTLPGRGEAVGRRRRGWQEELLLQNDGVRAKGLTPSAIDHVCPSCQEFDMGGVRRGREGGARAFKSFYHLNGIWQKAGFIFIVSLSLVLLLPPAVTFPLATDIAATRTAQYKSHEICKCPLWGRSLSARLSSLQSIY